MTFFQKIYTFSWIIAVIIALFFTFVFSKQFSFLQKRYFLFLLKPWKLVTFIIAAGFMTFIGPFSGDYSWDYVDGSIMSVLTYLTAPWVVGIFYRFKMRKASFIQIFVAFCLWMLSISWFYDLYICLRHNFYPPTSLPNIPLSSMLYLCAGLWWNLDWTPERGVYLSFKEEDSKWFSISKHSVFWKILRKGWVYMAIVALLCGLVIHALNHDGKIF